MNERSVREHLARFLDWEDAHVGFDKAVDGIPADKRGLRPAGFRHSAWELLEHLRIGQEDILDFCVSPRYEHALKWPDDYWPRQPEPPHAKAWAESVASFVRSRDELIQLAREADDLTAPVP